MSASKLFIEGSLGMAKGMRKMGKVIKDTKKAVQSHGKPDRMAMNAVDKVWKVAKKAQKPWNKYVLKNMPKSMKQKARLASRANTAKARQMAS
jgi:hypothetical protein